LSDIGLIVSRRIDPGAIWIGCSSGIAIGTFGGVNSPAELVDAFRVRGREVTPQQQLLLVLVHEIRRSS
jgi:hypothetical protein